MKIYDYGKTKTCLICGSIDGNIDKFIKLVINGLSNLKNFEVKVHPKEIERQARLARKREEEAYNPLHLHRPDMQVPHLDPRPFRTPKKPSPNYSCGYNLSNSLIIVDGSNYFGERDSKYYHDKLEMLNKVLSDNNTHILFVRGNDDPKYFEDTIINLSNIKTIQDYSVIKLAKFNCLCIGGGVSIDRTWRMEQEKRIGRKMYWENENVNFNEEDIDKILKDYNIACVVTSSCPSFVPPGMNYLKHMSWVSKDKNLAKEMGDERRIMDKIYNKIIESDKKPYVWVYSRFKNGNKAMVNDILFKSLSQLQFFHFNSVVSTFFKVDLSKNLKENEYVANEDAKKQGPMLECSDALYDADEIDVMDMPDENVEAETEAIDSPAMPVAEDLTIDERVPRWHYDYTITDPFNVENGITIENDMTYYNPGTLIAEATRSAMATDDREGHA